MENIIPQAFDVPDKRDFMFSEFKEILSGDKYTTRPREDIDIQNQGKTLGCTCFSGGHIINGNNIIEDKKLGGKRDQLNLMEKWNEFCLERGYSNSGSSIQTLANRFKKRGYIEGYVTLDGKGDKLVNQMKQALDIGKFISTGSAFGDWGKIKQTGDYSENGGKFVGHAFCIVDYGTGFFWAVNSYGASRGPHKGYFKIPFSMVDKLYSKLVFIDKDDAGKFATLASKEKARRMISIAKELYAEGNTELNNYFNKIQLSDNLKNIMKL